MCYWRPCFSLPVLPGSFMIQLRNSTYKKPVSIIKGFRGIGHSSGAFPLVSNYLRSTVNKWCCLGPRSWMWFFLVDLWLEFVQWTVMGNWIFCVNKLKHVSRLSQSSVELEQSLEGEHLLSLQWFDSVEFKSYKPSLAVCTIIMG